MRRSPKSAFETCIEANREMSRSATLLDFTPVVAQSSSATLVVISCGTTGATGIGG
jgi:hypothetical protein